jgi:hypothetical protein
MPGLPRKASSEPLRHVTLKKHSGPRTSFLGPFLLRSMCLQGYSDSAAGMVSLVFESQGGGEQAEAGTEL